MNAKIETIIKTVESNKYKMIVEGAVVGAVAGLPISLFRMSLQKAESLRGSVLSNIQGFDKWLLFYLLAVAVSIGVLYICCKKVPLCGGSGIPQVKGELLGKIEQPWMKVLPAKFVGGVCAIGTGMSLGREGPSIQMGSMVGKAYARLRGKVLNEEKMLITCGAGAGLAAAFCAPLAGSVFALEELHKNFSTEILIATMASSVAADFVSSSIFGLEPVFHLPEMTALPLGRYWMVILLGIILGAIGVLFNLCIDKMQDFYKWVRFTGLKVSLPYLMVIPLALLCPVALGSGHGLVSQVAAEEYMLGFLVLLLLIKFAFSVFCFSSGVPGGTFLPMLVLGALTGGIFALGMGQILGYEEMHVATFVVLGMTGSFSAISRAPITGVILITEMTGDFTNFLPLALVALIAYVMADILNGEPIYDQLTVRLLGERKAYGMTMVHRTRKVLLHCEVYIGSFMDGQTIDKMELPQGCLIVSVERRGREVVPGGNTVIEGGDSLTLLCKQSDILKVEERLDEICRSIKGVN